MWKNERFYLTATDELRDSVMSELPVLAKLFDHKVVLICLFVTAETPGAAPFEIDHENEDTLGGLHCIMWSVHEGKATRVDADEVFDNERQLWSKYDDESHGGQPTRGHDRWIILEEAKRKNGCSLSVEIA